MLFSVACPCGKTYTKPDHKIGTIFRCHMCGRELMISEPSASTENHAVPQSDQASITSSPWDAASATDTDTPAPARPSFIRTTIAWVLIFLGLAGVVGGLGQIYIYSIIEKAMTEDANAQARMFGEIQALKRTPPNDAAVAYTMAFCGIGIGLVLAYTGMRFRKVE